MKKFLTSSVIVISFIVYAFLHNKSQETITVPPPQLPLNSLPTQPDTTQQPVSGDTTTPTPQATTGQYKDGVYTGPAADAFYGNIQVRATIQNGKLVDVEFLQYPNDQRESLEINSQAMPYLKEEAIQAQSANVDTVTRATDSSMAFRQSLADALSQAKN